MQETKLAASAINDVREDFAAKGKTFIHGRPCKVASRKGEHFASAAKEASKGGVAIALKKPRSVVKVAETDLMKQLKCTSRWEEVVIPVKADTTHAGFANIYGHSRAASDPRCYRENEALLAKAIRRLIEFGDVPYILAGDININPACSEVIAAAVEAGIAVDVGHAARNDSEPEPTYRRSGPYQGMKENETNVSRIDVVLANPAAATAISSFKPRWDLVVADHVPLEVQLSLGHFTKDTVIFDGPKPVTTTGIPKLTESLQSGAYSKARELFGENLDMALRRWRC